MMIIQYAISTARRPRSTSSVFCLHIFLSLADSCSLLVPRLSRPTDWSKVIVDCIHFLICRPLGLVTGFNEICNACLAGVPLILLKSKFVMIYFISP